MGTDRIISFLNAEEIKKINAAVKIAESTTAGEIKPLVVEKSSTMTFKKSQAWAVNRRAKKEFFKRGLDHTKEHTGVLIMISLKERRVAVRGGIAIDEKVDKAAWEDVMNPIIAGIKKGNPGDGICEAIKKAGEILTKHFPIKPGDKNEISDEIEFDR